MTNMVWYDLNEKRFMHVTDVTYVSMWYFRFLYFTITYENFYIRYIRTLFNSIRKLLIQSWYVPYLRTYEPFENRLKRVFSDFKLLLYTTSTVRYHYRTWYVRRDFVIFLEKLQNITLLPYHNKK